MAGRGPYSCRHHDRLFRKRKPNPNIKHRLVLNGVRMAIGDEDQLRQWARMHRITGYTIEGDE